MRPGWGREELVEHVQKLHPFPAGRWTPGELGEMSIGKLHAIHSHIHGAPGFEIHEIVPHDASEAGHHIPSVEWGTGPG